MKSTLLGMSSRTWGIEGFLQKSFGNSRHLWMWDYKGLALELLTAGFEPLRVCRRLQLLRDWGHDEADQSPEVFS